MASADSVLDIMRMKIIVKATSTAFATASPMPIAGVGTGLALAQMRRDHDQDADEPDGDRAPAVEPHRFAQHDRGERHDDQRRGKADRGDVGERQIASAPRNR